MLGEILKEEQLKELKFTDNMADSYFYMLEQAWQDPLKTYRQISISSLLRGKKFNFNNYDNGFL